MTLARAGKGPRLEAAPPRARRFRISSGERRSSCHFTRIAEYGRPSALRACWNLTSATSSRTRRTSTSHPSPLSSLQRSRGQRLQGATSWSPSRVARRGFGERGIEVGLESIKSAYTSLSRWGETFRWIESYLVSFIKAKKNLLWRFSEIYRYWSWKKLIKPQKEWNSLKSKLTQT